MKITISDSKTNSASWTGIQRFEVRNPVQIQIFLSESDNNDMLQTSRTIIKLQFYYYYIVSLEVGCKLIACPIKSRFLEEGIYFVPIYP